MKIVCDRDKLLDGIMTSQKAVSGKSTLPILGGLLLDCRTGDLRIMSTDLDIGIECTVEAEVVEKGWVVLDSRLLGEIIRKLSFNDVEIIIDETNVASIKCGNSHFTIQGQGGEEFPQLPEVRSEKKISLPQDLLKSIVRQTVFACAVDETRPILTGVLMECKGEEISMAALDGFRLALRTIKVSEQLPDISVVVPSKTLNEIYKILKDHEQEVEIFFTDNQMLFRIGSTKVVSRLLEGEFINYSQIIPDEYTTRVKVKTLDFLESCERASLLAREGKNNLIRLEICEDVVKITSNAEIGMVNEEVNVVMEGKELKIAFNSKYLTDALKVIESEHIEMQLTTNINPCVLKPVQSENYTYLLLPVRVAE